MTFVQSKRLLYKKMICDSNNGTYTQPLHLPYADKVVNRTVNKRLMDVVNETQSKKGKKEGQQPANGARTLHFDLWNAPLAPLFFSRSTKNQISFPAFTQIPTNPFPVGTPSPFLFSAFFPNSARLFRLPPVSTLRMMFVTM